jgi:decaprenylphospho-beta-D-erythro-pentofuranosid-2-ulose 2-reductase
MSARNPKSRVISEPPLWLILGASSAIARAFIRLVASEGAELILGGRDMKDMERTAADARVRGATNVDLRHFGALNRASHSEFVAALPRRPFNVLLAFGLLHAQEAIDRNPVLAEEVIAVNYLGAVSILSRLEGRLAEQGEGAVVVLSSVAGDRGRPSNFIYGSAKAGLNTYLQGLRARLSGRGVTVTTIKAGFMDTAMTYGLPGMFLVASPEACARTCRAAAAGGRDILYFPVFWWGIMAVIKAVPEALFKRLNL